MSSEKLLGGMPAAASHSFRQWGEPAARIFDDLPMATILEVSRPDTGDISPMLLSYTIEFQYKQFKWRLVKKASQVLYLHFALKKRAFIEEIYEKQEQVKEWLHTIGIVDQTTAVVQDDDEPDDGAVPLHNNEDTVKNRNVPSRAVLPIIRPAIGGQQSISDRAKEAMQGYLNHFLGNLDIVNSQEVCKFLEVSRLSFLHEYGPKLKEGYVMVKHLSNIPRRNSDTNCCLFSWVFCCQHNWHKVWAVLKPGFIALLDDPFDIKLLDIIIFNVLPHSKVNGGSPINLADQIKERNPLRYTFKVSNGNQSIRIRTTSNAKVRQWVSAINDAGLKPPEGWCHAHRFESYAPQRGLIEDGSQAQWFVDGKAAFEAIASAIEDAKSEIFITGWWVCPELYLRRPFDSNFSSRLDALLELKAKQGVQIYILLYKEVSIALKINSSYSQRKLLNIHENVKVLRYPDHLSTGVYLWSHHEKLVIVDYQICFIGGLDLCFGRYDTTEHKVGDSPSIIWPGKDYYNPRESEPNSWEDTMKDELDRGKYPRMPWHDVHCAVWGPPCRDIARHFVQRWNHAKRNKAPNEQTIPLLMPHHHMVIPHYMGKSREIDIENKTAEDKRNDFAQHNSFSSLSALQDIPLLLPQESDGLLDSHNDNNLHSEMSLDNSKEWWQNPDQETNQRPSSANDDSGQVGPRTTCRCQVIRSVSQWSAGTSQTEESIHKAYCSLIERAEHFVYIENQFFISGLSEDDIIQNRVLEAIYRRILRARKEQKCFRVIVVIPLLPGFQGGLDDGDAATVRALMHWQYRTISWKKTSIMDNLTSLLGSKANDYISFYGLRSHGRLFEGGPLATSQVYVHSKLIIVDDRAALIGSSNINDRSLLGSRDSEIGVLIEDNEFVDSTMNGQPWKAGKFSFSLRCFLWSEHLDLHAGEVIKISDPVSDSTYKDLWLATAEKNSTIYQEVFSCFPNDLIHSRAAFRQCIGHWKEKLGHTTIDMGIALEKVEIYDEDGKVKLIDSIERLECIKGHLVCFPLQFMCQEDLRPFFIESEFYASSQVFH
ncbi:phospholipase D zeta 1 [Cannabis sativa]|uniref:phospholipase D zeta 1 n=1 Tax=Cannabis sativa TaxID=3483 RepID=UPI0029CA9F6C|nr:phospholipase D zeta 1 [Cannabis sativa]